MLASCSNGVWAGSGRVLVKSAIARSQPRRCMSGAVSLSDLLRDLPSAKEDSQQTDSSAHVASESSKRDPWSPIFDKVQSSPSPLQLRNHRRFPKGYFSSTPHTRPGSKRSYATQAAAARNDTSDSLFSSKTSAWDRVFADLRDAPPTLPPSSMNPARTHHRPTPQAGGVRPPRRQSMTAREINAFDEMFNMIFNAVSEHKDGAPDAGAAGGALPSIGHAPSAPGMDSLYGRLRRQSKRVKWTSEADAALDRKKEEMELCDTDQQLLEWAMQEVFGESKRFEAAAREAAATPGAEVPPLQPPAYPHLLALLMRTFRDKYRDPHLALSMFDHARHLSIPSYVFGCTAPAYNELLATRWACFRDLRGVRDALEEMQVNGVDPDARTRQLVEGLRREVGARNLWAEESELDSGEVWQMLERIERLSVRDTPVRKRAVERRAVPAQTSEGAAKGSRRWKASDEWKGKVLRETEPDDDYQFNKWVY